MSSLAQHSKESRIVIGIADFAVSEDPEATIVTYALGSCLGIAIYDPVARVAGMLHTMLPTSTIDGEDTNPARFVDTGVPALFRAAYELGARKERIYLCVAGGASMTAGGQDKDFFQIGRRNYVFLKKVLWKNGVVIRDEDVGGSQSRTLSIDVGTGEVSVKSGRSHFTLSRRFPRRS